MINVGPMEVAKFSGGITDNIFGSTAEKAEILDNLNLLSNETPQTRPGSIVDNTTYGNDRIPAGNQRIGTLINYDNSAVLLIQSSTKFYYRNPVIYTTILGPTGNDVFTSGGVSNVTSYATWNKHIYITHDGWPRPMMIFRDQANVMQVRSSGLPALSNIPSVAIGLSGTQSFLYAFHYDYTYQVGNQTFEIAGPIVLLEVLGASDPSANPNHLTGIPALVNGTTDNYDVVNVKVKIFRTTTGGTTLWYLNQINNGTTTFTDNYSDLTIVNSSIIYTSDGTLDNEPPPFAKYVHIVNNIAYYGYLKEGAQEFPFDFRASQPFQPDSCPTLFRDTVEDTIHGISSVQSIPIILCSKYIYRVEGSFSQFGRGSMNHTRISDTAGCVSNLSIVQAENGLYWAGNDGFYYSDGYMVRKISDNNNEAYKNLISAQTNKSRIYGKFNELERKIVWGIQSDTSSFDNDTLWVLDLRYGKTAATATSGMSYIATFTTWSGGNSFRPTALEFFNRQMYRADSRGYVFIHDEQYTTDPLVDTLDVPVNWHTQPIIYHYRSVAFNFGSTYMRKIATKILLTAKNKTNISIQVTAINDDGKTRRALKEIRWRRNFVWGDPEFVWGNPDCFWNSEGLIEQWRRMPAKGLRFSYLQIDVTNSYTTITDSDTIGKATFNSTSKSAVLDTAAMSTWPLDCVGYFISTEVDQYQRQFQIIGRTNDTITILDPQGILPIGSLKWQIEGIKKGEVLNLLSYNIHWANISKTQATYETGQSGGNK